MNKDFIISEIKRTAENGRALGKERFYSETGIKVSDWYGKYWTKWSHAVSEAGFLPNSKQQPLALEVLKEKLLDLIQELNRFPTSGDLRMKARSDSSFPSHNTFNRLGNKSERAKIILEIAVQNNLDKVVEICLPEIKEDNELNNDIQSSKIQEFGSVYLYKAGTSYKIGRTNKMKRRNREIQLQLPEEAKLIHRISTDDPVGIEAYWHKRFEGKRLNGEWFKLTAQDVKVFKRRKFM